MCAHTPLKSTSDGQQNGFSRTSGSRMFSMRREMSDIAILPGVGVSSENIQIGGWCRSGDTYTLVVVTLIPL